jgi:hypothetical protein
MNGNQIGAGPCEIVDQSREVLRHEVNVEGVLRERPYGGHQVREEQESRYEVIIRNVDVVHVNKGIHALHLSGKPGVVG